MNCKSVRKFLLAFVDGQLGVQMSCEVLDHLKMCTACSTVVEGQQALRRALQKSAERTTVPPGLEARIRHAIETEDIVKPHKPSTTVRNFRAGRALAMAACIVIGFTLAWPLLPVGPASVDSDSAAIAAGNVTPADNVARMLVLQHNKCSRKCEAQTHHDHALPQDRASLSDAFSTQFNGALAAAAPDLSGYGYEFESASFCNPISDSTEPAAHVMYVHPGYGTRLSFFTVPYWNGIDFDDRTTDRFHPFIHSLRDCEDHAMVGWHEAGVSYLIVGQFDAESMAEAIRDLKLTGDRTTVGGVSKSTTDR